MPNRPPRSYEEIVRSTVPNPDSSFRPAREVERKARDQRALDPADQRLFDDIHDALIAEGINATRLRIEVDRNRVVLRGTVRDISCCNQVVEAVRGVKGVVSIINQLVIEPD